MTGFVVKLRHVVFLAVSQTIGAIRPSPVTTPVAAATPQQMYSRLNASKIQLVLSISLRGAAVIDLIDHICNVHVHINSLSACCTPVCARV